MKRTFNINLGGQVFTIDEDAYQLLNRYLNDLKILFRGDIGYEEIMQDIEYRMSELFREKFRLGYQIITIEMAEAIINQVGKPEELGGENESQMHSSQLEANNISGEKKCKKRLYRNIDDQILGGVSSGIASYIGWDPVWVRLIFFILIFFWGITAGVYLLLWIIVPAAKTTAQKLEMEGKCITIDNIGKSVTQDYAQINSNEKKEDSFFREIIQTVLTIIATLLKIFVIGIIFIIAIPLFIIAFVFIIISLIISSVGVEMLPLSFLPFHLDNVSIHFLNPFHTILLVLSISILCIIPIGTIIYLLISSTRNLKPINKNIKWCLLIIWTLSLISTLFLTSQWIQSLPVFTY